MVETGGLEAGDVKFKPGRAVPMHHDGGDRGAPVTFDPTSTEDDFAVMPAGSGDVVIGQYADDPAVHENRKITVRVGKLILVARADSAVSDGDLLDASGTGGYVAAGTEGAAPTDYAPMALEEAEEGQLFYVAFP